MSRAGDELVYLLRCGIYAVRFLLCIVYGVLQFLGKPGSRIIAPALFAAVAYLKPAPVIMLIADVLPYLQGSSATGWSASERVTCAGILLALCAGVTLAPIALYIRATLSFVAGSLGFIVRATIVLLFVGAVLAAYCGLPLNSELLRYLPFGIGDRLLAFDWQMSDDQYLRRALALILACAVALACCVYVAGSRLLALLLGAFPPPTWPLRPMRKLRARTRAIQSVAVRIAVPKPPRRMRVTSTEQLPV